MSLFYARCLLDGTRWCSFAKRYRLLAFFCDFFLEGAFVRFFVVRLAGFFAASPGRIVFGRACRG
jgi:hypothetical protein